MVGNEICRIHSVSGEQPNLYLTSEHANEGGQVHLVGTSAGGGDFSATTGFMDIFQNKLRLVHIPQGLNSEVAFECTPNTTAADTVCVDFDVRIASTGPDGKIILTGGSNNGAATRTQVNLGTGNDRDTLLVYHCASPWYTGTDQTDSNKFIIGRGSLVGTNPSLTVDTSDNVVIPGTLAVDNIKVSGNTIETTDSNGSMLFECNGTGKYIFGHDGGGATAMHIIGSTSNGGWLHFMNSTTGTTGVTDGWKIGMDGSESFQIYNEETNATSMILTGGGDVVKFYGSGGNVCSLTVGDDTNQHGALILERKDVNEFPYIKMTSADDTDSYLFVANDGTLRIHSAIPTADGDGGAV